MQLRVVNMTWIVDVVVGALAPGVNLSTQVLLNVVLGVAYATLIVLLVLSIYSNPALVPHVIVLLILATGLWLSINWFISNIGLTDPSQQKEQLLGSQQATGDQQSGDSQQAENKKST